MSMSATTATTTTSAAPPRGRRHPSGFVVAALSLLSLLPACMAVPITACPDEAPSGAPTRTVEVKARMFEFDPAEIRVRKGEQVTLILESEDVTHGFGLAELDIEVDLPKGQPIEIIFYAVKKGTTSFECTHFCGLGHFGMDGEIIIE